MPKHSFEIMLAENNFYTKVLVTDAIDKGYQTILRGNFNLSLDKGYRGQVMEEFCSAFSLDIVNGVSMGNDPNM